MWSTDIGYFGTFRLADVNGDGMADICARGSDGIYIALSRGSFAASRSFLQKKRWLATEMTDKQSWKPADYSTTFQLGDINGDKRADICGRGVGGVISGFAP